MARAGQAQLRILQLERENEVLRELMRDRDAEIRRLHASMLERTNKWKQVVEGVMAQRQGQQGPCPHCMVKDRDIEAARETLADTQALSARRASLLDGAVRLLDRVEDLHVGAGDALDGKRHLPITQRWGDALTFWRQVGDVLAERNSARQAAAMIAQLLAQDGERDRSGSPLRSGRETAPPGPVRRPGMGLSMPSRKPRGKTPPPTPPPPADHAPLRKERGNGGAAASPPPALALSSSLRVELAAGIAAAAAARSVGSAPADFALIAGDKYNCSLDATRLPQAVAL